MSELANEFNQKLSSVKTQNDFKNLAKFSKSSVQNVNLVGGLVNKPKMTDLSGKSFVQSCYKALAGKSDKVYHENILGNNYYCRINSHVNPRLKPLSEVRNEIVTKLAADKKAVLLKEYFDKNSGFTNGWKHIELA